MTTLTAMVTATESLLGVGAVPSAFRRVSGWHSHKTLRAGCPNINVLLPLMPRYRSESKRLSILPKGQMTNQ